MCGISFYYSNKSEYQSQLESSLALTKHRGPDHTGIEHYSFDGSTVGLGHNRLSIVDTSEAGNQPMHKDNLTIIFNGEIYNFQQLRKELESKGFTFKSHSDTEVILNAFHAYGVACFARFQGMFAFVLLDHKSKKMFIVRDTIGIKPVYLYQDSDSIFGCSEIKGLKAYKDVDIAISRKDTFEFFNTGFLYEPDTGYENIKKLMPGHYLEVDIISNDRNIVQYENTATDPLASLNSLVEDAVIRQEVADVPLGVFFSGGADSSILASLANKSELLFAKYSDDPTSDVDLEYSKKISTHLNKKLNITSIEMDDAGVENILDSFDYVAQYSEELVSDYTFWSTYKLSKAARENGYIVMLSGMGGDEAFAGYPRYLLLKYHRLIKLIIFPILITKKLKLFPESFSKKIERLFSYSQEKNWQLAYARLLGYFSTQELEALFDDASGLLPAYTQKLDQVAASYKGNKSDKIKLAQHMDLTGFLSHNLSVSDKASMLASIELRVPLLDEKVVAKGIQQASNVLVANRILKSPLKKLLSTLLPMHLIERPKTGFNPPLDGIISKIGRERIKAELAELTKYLNAETVNKVIDSHFDGSANNTYKLWQLIYFARWMRHNHV